MDDTSDNKSTDEHAFSLADSEFFQSTLWHYVSGSYWKNQISSPVTFLLKNVRFPQESCQKFWTIFSLIFWHSLFSCSDIWSKSISQFFCSSSVLLCSKQSINNHFFSQMQLLFHIWIRSWSCLMAGSSVFCNVSFPSWNCLTHIITRGIIFNILFAWTYNNL